MGFPFNGAGLPVFDAISWIENAYQLLTSRASSTWTPRPTTCITSRWRPEHGHRGRGTADAAGTARPVGQPGAPDPDQRYERGITYSGTSWNHQAGRTYGDYDNDVHVATNNGDSASYTFTGSGIEVLTEENDDEGDIGVYSDGSLDETVSADDATQRLAQQAVVSISGLSPGTHTIKLVKESGTYMLLDALVVIPTAISPVHNITFSGITFEYTTWNTPTPRDTSTTSPECCGIRLPTSGQDPGGRPGAPR